MVSSGKLAAIAAPIFDDISSPGGGMPDGIGPWTLSLILRYGHS